LLTTSMTRGLSFMLTPVNGAVKSKKLEHAGETKRRMI